MRAEDAALKLWELYREAPWWISVGVGVDAAERKTLVVYTERKPPTDVVPATYEGYEVVVKRIGRIRPAGEEG